MLIFLEKNFLALIFSRKSPIFYKENLSYIYENGTLDFAAEALKIKKLHLRNPEKFLYSIFFIRTFFHLNFFHNILIRIFFIIRIFIHLNFFQQIFFIKRNFYVFNNTIINLFFFNNILTFL